MLFEISKQQINQETVDTVSARELHTFLESKQDFSTWVKNRIEKYEFMENQDFVSFHKIMERETGATTRIEYHLTLDMAKELAMIENNPKGREARQYFIECEKRLKEKEVATPVIGVIEDKMRALAYMVSLTSLSPDAKETLLVTTSETLLGLPIPHRPVIEQKTYSASEIGEMMGISARELHKFLEVQSKFADWIKNRIGKYGFVENQDYVCVSKILETHRTDGQEGVATTKEYHITLDMAKELAMIENNPKGREARQYFIECEKQLKQQKPMTQLEIVVMMANQLLEQERKAVEFDKRLTKVEKRQQQLDQDNDHYTIKGFCSLHELDLSNGKMSAISKKVKKLSELKGYAWHEITDPRFGKVKTYHVDMLTEIFTNEKLI